MIFQVAVPVLQSVDASDAAAAIDLVVAALAEAGFNPVPRGLSATGPVAEPDLSVPGDSDDGPGEQL